MKWTLSLILACCAAFSQAQRFTHLDSNAISVSLLGGLTFLTPSLFEDEPTYPEDSMKVRSFKVCYYRKLNKTFDLRASYQFSNRYRSWGNGKNLTAYGQNHRSFHLVQTGISWRWDKDLRLSPFFDVGVEGGYYFWLQNYWERYDFNSNGPGSYRSRYHENKVEYLVFGTTLNVGLHLRLNEKWYLSSSAGLRYWVLDHNLTYDLPLRNPNLLSQSNALMLGVTF